MNPAALALILACLTPPDAAEEPLAWWQPGQRATQNEYERVLLAAPDPAFLRRLHDLFGSQPHVAGTPGDVLMIERMADTFAAMGFEVERHWIDVYLSFPVSAALEILSPIEQSLPLRESTIAEDPDTASTNLPIGFNAYSASGTAEGAVVYANYGRKEDFQKLRELGIDLTGRIVIARYGGNYRGYKAKFAEEAGAAGLIIYTDPDDSGYRKGAPYPEGGFANASYIQRGSIKTLPYPGDALTPFVESTENAERLPADEVDLPRIPVQPVGWGAAQEIMSRMTGAALPQDLVSSWQGGLPFAYRLEGGEELRVRLEVEQERRIARTANVIAKLPGSARPEEQVIIGCHHDAWGFGAADPLAGLIVLFESARSFAEAAMRGYTPRRTIVFAAWGAEEFGIIGSTEYCEAHTEELASAAVAYINLDMAAMGPDFRAGAAPLLESVIVGAAAAVPQARAENGRTVLEEWADRGERGPVFGSLGGGSDHVGFYCHLGIPSAGLGGGGSHGVSYHSAYDTVRWYRKVVGEDYAPAEMVTQMTNVIAARLANARLLPLDPRRYAPDIRSHLERLAQRAGDRGMSPDFQPLYAAVAMLEQVWTEAMNSAMDAMQRSALSETQIADLNAILLTLERQWLVEEGLTERPWYRSLYAATDPDSGYSAWILPELRGAIEHTDTVAMQEAVRKYETVLRALADRGREFAAAAGGKGDVPAQRH